MRSADSVGLRLVAGDADDDWLAGLAAHSRRAYRRWGQRMPWGGSADDYARQLAELAATHGVASVRQARAAVSRRHRIRSGGQALFAPGAAARRGADDAERIARAPSPPGPAATWADVDRIVDAALASGGSLGLRDAALIRVAADAALRRSEVTALLVGDLDRSGAIWLRRSKTDQRSAGRWMRVSPLAAELCAELAAGRSRSAPLFAARHGGRLGDDQATRRLRLHAEASGVDDASRLTVHSLRRGMAGELTRRGLPDGHVMSVMRWSSPEMIRHYADVDGAAAAALAELRFDGPRKVQL